MYTCMLFKFIVSYKDNMSLLKYVKAHLCISFSRNACFKIILLYTCVNIWFYTEHTVTGTVLCQFYVTSQIAADFSIIIICWGLLFKYYLNSSFRNIMFACIILFKIEFCTKLEVFIYPQDTGNLCNPYPSLACSSKFYNLFWVRAKEVFFGENKPK